MKNTTEVPVKACTECKQVKPITDFYKTSSRGNVYPTAACKPCHNMRSSKRHDERSSFDLKYRVKRLLHEVKGRAVSRNLQYDLDFDWVLERFETGLCEVTGLPLHVFEIGGPGSRPWGPSLDRVDQQKGYTKDNVKVVCWIYNRAKGCGTHADVLHFCNALIAANDNTKR